MRHLSVDQSGVYWGRPVVGGRRPHVDRRVGRVVLCRGSTGARWGWRQNGSDPRYHPDHHDEGRGGQVRLCVVGGVQPEPNDQALGGLSHLRLALAEVQPQHHGQRGRRAGNSTDHDRRCPHGVDRAGTSIFEPGYVDHSLVGRITGPHPEILSPKFDVDVFQVPIIELDIDLPNARGEDADRLVDGLKVYWTTGDCSASSPKTG